MSAADELHPWVVPAARKFLELGYVDDEVVDELERMSPARAFSKREARLVTALVAELRREMLQVPTPVPAPKRASRAGPERIVTREQVEAVRDALAAEGKLHGYKSIANKGGWHPSTVARRLRGQ